jgi:Fe-S oxidoreductase
MARRAGNEYLAQMLIQQNVETLNGYKPKQILTGCPHCSTSSRTNTPSSAPAIRWSATLNFFSICTNRGA